ncbi:uncharacterized protein LOC62_07G009602 [Vanrija pseudolonga]|uniref:Uncharacterized protein n=1 Tax=Vanrija pseudolonga TaxID=143232 RepID=A0AAF1BUI2_9TREE|nr:hypothetical protein LOC62_07G009602 [Vanrija pseudolonga]
MHDTQRDMSRVAVAALVDASPSKLGAEDKAAVGLGLQFRAIAPCPFESKGSALLANGAMPDGPGWNGTCPSGADLAARSSVDNQLGLW